MHKVKNKKDDKKANEKRDKSKQEEEKTKQDEMKEKDEKKKKEKLYREMTKAFRNSCTKVLSKKLPKDLEGLEREQDEIIQQLQNEIDKFLKKREDQAKTNSQLTHGAITKTIDQSKPDGPFEPAPDYDCSTASAIAPKSYSDGQNGGRALNAEEVRSLEARYKQEKDKLKRLLDDAQCKVGKYQEERSKLNERAKMVEESAKNAARYKEEKEKLEKTLENTLEDARCKEVKLKQEHISATNTLKNQLQNQYSQVKKLTLEKKEALTRLSELAGRKLLDNNPNIADLSTEIRPTKIGENFMQVYDNEWTDAFEELEKNDQDDKHCITTLLKILKEAFEHTQVEAKNFEAVMISMISSSSLDQKDARSAENISKEEIGLIRQLKKASAMRTKISIQDEFVKGKSWIKWQKTKEFAEKCVEMCWFMAIQTPPMTLIFDMKHLQPFDEKYYKKYMTSGDRFDFLVWPCTLLHKDGPVVAKGIAEATAIDAAQTETPAPAANDKKQKEKSREGTSAIKYEQRKENSKPDQYTRNVRNEGRGDEGDEGMKSLPLSRGDTSTCRSYPEQESSVVKNSSVRNIQSRNGSEQNGSKNRVTKIQVERETKF